MEEGIPQEGVARVGLERYGGGDSSRVSAHIDAKQTCNLPSAIVHYESDSDMD